MFRSLGALVADVLAVLIFVAIGLYQHGDALSTTNIVIVAWPFATGLLLGHLAIRAWRFPFRIWPHGVFVWAITLVTAMAIRTLFQAGTEVSFVIVTAITLAVLMLGWRSLALLATRGERRAVTTSRQSPEKKTQEKDSEKESKSVSDPAARD
ncbi:DUF3054 domain-containing protein [Brachybacterium squillarum]|uniref:DUF3054 domain-containing protein n=1 Tax=Brachybacterium squillarum TaxID=661979 RepID=UPI000262A04B|nr:DUF3054 domain-containing protein [Brachybacterium squillarum]